MQSWDTAVRSAPGHTKKVCLSGKAVLRPNPEDANSALRSKSVLWPLPRISTAPEVQKGLEKGVMRLGKEDKKTADVVTRCNPSSKSASPITEASCSQLLRGGPALSPGSLPTNYRACNRFSNSPDLARGKISPAHRIGSFFATLPRFRQREALDQRRLASDEASSGGKGAPRWRCPSPRNTLLTFAGRNAGSGPLSLFEHLP